MTEQQDARNKDSSDLTEEIMASKEYKKITDFIGRGKGFPRQIMHLLLWTDIVSRLDILILEIRHLQCNIISYLKQPSLYAPLRLEEHFLWGEVATKLKDEKGSASSTVGGDVKSPAFPHGRGCPPGGATNTDHSPMGEDINGCHDTWLWSDKDRIGQSWHNLFCQIPFPGLVAEGSGISGGSLTRPAAFLDHLSIHWIIDYPATDEGWDIEKRQYSDDISHKESNNFSPSYLANSTLHPEKRNAIDCLIRSCVSEMETHGLWSAEAHRAYNALAALQKLKQLVFRDKLHLVYWGFVTFGWLEPLLTSKKLSEAGIIGPISDAKFRRQAVFLLGLRRTISTNLHDYVQKLGYFQAQFLQITELGYPDVHRPMQDRRREQGLYASYLTDRAIGFYSCIRQVTRELRGQDSTEGGASAESNHPIMLHRWHHALQSQVAWLDPVDVGDKRQPRGGGKANRDQSRSDPQTNESHREERTFDNHPHEKENRRISVADGVCLVGSSFFMHDRPDLIPTIAHEVAHYILYKDTNELDIMALQAAPHQDVLSQFLKMVHVVLRQLAEGSDGDHPVPGGHVNWRIELTREMACDILSYAVLGPSYLYAVTLEVAGSGMEEIYRGHQREYDIGIAYWMFLKDPQLQVRELEIEWYYRLGVLCALARGLESDLSPFDQTLISGVEALLDDVWEWIRRASPPQPLEQGSDEAIWRTPLLKLVKALNKSPLLKALRRWREDILRQQRHWSASRAQQTGAEDGGAGCKATTRPAGRVIDDEDHVNEVMRRLAPPVQKFVIEQLVARKAQRPGRLLKRFIQAFCKNDHKKNTPEVHGPLFQGLYCAQSNNSLTQSSLHSGDQSGNTINTRFGNMPDYLFPRLCDIPWQSAVARAIDFLAFGGSSDQVCTVLQRGALLDSYEEVRGTKSLPPIIRYGLCQQINRDIQPGNELYHWALEVDYWDKRPPTRRLSHACRIVEEIIGYAKGYEKGDETAKRLVRKRLELISQNYGGDGYIAYPWTTADAKNLGETPPEPVDNIPSDAAPFEQQLALLCGLQKDLNIWINGIGDSEKLVDSPGREVAAENKFSEMISTKARQLRDVIFEQTKVGDIESLRASERRVGRELAGFLGARQLLRGELLGTDVQRNGKRLPYRERVALDERVTGHKLQQLAEILAQPRLKVDDNGEKLSALGVPIIWQLYDYSRYHSNRGRADLVDKVCKHARHDPQASSCFSMVKLSLVSISEYIPDVEKLPDATADGGMNGEYHLSSVFVRNPSSSTDVPSLLGRFDSLLITRSIPVERWLLPAWRGGRSETSPTRIKKPFFERRQLAIPFCTQLPISDSHDATDGSDNKYPVIGYIFASLGSRGYRPELLRRLIGTREIFPGVESDQMGRHSGSNDPGYYCSHLGRWLSFADRVYLAEGFGEIVVEVRAAGYREKTDDWMHLRRLFKIQGCLYDDFSVERTETLLTNNALPLVLHEKNAKKFTITLMSRVVGDRAAADVVAHYYQDIVHAENELRTRATVAHKSAGCCCSCGKCLLYEGQNACLTDFLFGTGMTDSVIRVDTPRFRCALLALRHQSRDSGSGRGSDEKRYCRDGGESGKIFYDYRDFSCEGADVELVTLSLYQLYHSRYLDDVITSVSYRPSEDGG